MGGSSPRSEVAGRSGGCILNFIKTAKLSRIGGSIVPSCLQRASLHFGFKFSWLLGSDWGQHLSFMKRVWPPGLMGYEGLV